MASTPLADCAEPVGGTAPEGLKLGFADVNVAPVGDAERPPDDFEIGDGAFETGDPGVTIEPPAVDATVGTPVGFEPLDARDALPVAALVAEGVVVDEKLTLTVLTQDVTADLQYSRVQLRVVLHQWQPGLDKHWPQPAA